MYVPGEAVPVSFVIHNREQHDVTYVYRVYADNPVGATISTARLRANETRIITTAITPLGNTRVKISVDLLDQAQSIHFWVGQAT